MGSADAAMIYHIGIQAGMTRDEVDLAVRELSPSYRDLAQALQRDPHKRSAIERAVTAAARDRREATVAVVAEAEKLTKASAPAKPELATPRQVDFIMQLLAKRGHDAVGGGFMTGPTTRTEVALMTKVDASLYITSLKEDY